MALKCLAWSELLLEKIILPSGSELKSWVNNFNKRFWNLVPEMLQLASVFFRDCNNSNCALLPHRYKRAEKHYEDKGEKKNVHGVIHD